jgi:hypothetical protein
MYQKIDFFSLLPGDYSFRIENSLYPLACNNNITMVVDREKKTL